jgi:hypothetical protein
MADNNIHPITGSGANLGKIGALFKSNPFGSFLAALFLAALIVPPRKRKYKPKRRRTGKKRRKTRLAPVKPIKVKKGKKSKKKGSRKRSGPAAPPRSVTNPRPKPARTTTAGSHRGNRAGAVPQWVKDKGFNNWTDYMTYLRSRRKK